MSNQPRVNPFFTPTQISGCQLWLDAADTNTITLSGTNVTQWRDKSGKNFVASNLGTVTTQKLNGQNALYMPQTRMSITNFSQTVYSTTFVVANAQNASFFMPLGNYNTYVATFNYSLYYFNTGANSIDFKDSVNPLGTPVVSANTNFIFSIGYGGGTNTSVYSINGTQRGASVWSGVAQSNTTLTNTLYINGSSSSSTETSVVAEIIIFNAVLTLAQAQQVEGYLAWKWGLQSSLPSTHPYKNSFLVPLSNPPTSLPIVLQNPSVNLWSPRQISSCQLWLDGADSSTISLSSSKVTSWVDKINRYNFTQATDGNRPTYISNGLNGNNYLQFTQSNSQYLGGPTTLPIGINSVTMYCVFSCVNNTDMSIFNKGGLGSATGRVQFWRASGLNSILLGITGSGTDRVDFVDRTALNTFQITGFVHDRGTSLVSAYQNGSFIKSAPADPTTNYTTSTQMGVGAYGNASGTFSPPYGFYMNGGICEILIFFSSVSTSQREQLEGYLAWKWGLVSLLPSTHPYKTIVPSLAPVSLSGISRGIINSWRPTLISGCQLWLDASDRSSFTLSGTTLASIQDKSPTAKTITVTSAPVYNSTIFNNLPAFVFASGNRLSTPTTALGNSMTLVAVYRVTVNATSVPLSVGFNGNETGIGFNSFYAYYNIYDNGVNESGNNRFTTNNVNLIHVGTKSPTSPNLTSYISGTPSTPVNSGYSNANTTIYISGGFSFVGNLAEAIVYSSALTLSQVQQVEGYLAWKWGLQGSLPATHPFKNWPPAP